MMDACTVCETGFWYDTTIGVEKCVKCGRLTEFCTECDVVDGKCSVCDATVYPAVVLDQAFDCSVSSGIIIPF